MVTDLVNKQKRVIDTQSRLRKGRLNSMVSLQQKRMVVVHEARQQARNRQGAIDMQKKLAYNANRERRAQVLVSQKDQLEKQRVQREVLVRKNYMQRIQQQHDAVNANMKRLDEL